MHIHVPFIMYCSRLVVQEINMTMFVESQSFISLPSFMFVSAPVSELIVSRSRTRRITEIVHFQFKAFPGYIIYPFFNQRYLLSTCMLVRSPVHHKLKVIIKISSNAGHTRAIPIYTILPYCVIVQGCLLCRCVYRTLTPRCWLS